MPVSPENWQTNGFGLYLHWPFCQAKCPYCDFNSHVTARIDHDRWRSAYLAELDRVAVETPDRVLSTVFLGGGTPSLMPASLVDAILERVHRNWRCANDLEVTIEANPTSSEAERFAGYATAGVNRLSLGVQALNDADLKALGRLHSVDEALRALDLARTSFERVSFDLIYARQDQSLSDWRQELGRALSMKPSLLSLYQLTIEDGTAFGDRYARGRLRGLPDEDLGADLWEVTQSMTDAAGLPGYEISNHAAPGAEARHNLMYWRSGDWFGIGPGAHGRLTLDGARWSTEAPRAPGAWLAAVEADEAIVEQRQELTAHQAQDERLLMGLRLRDGIPWNGNKYVLSNNISALSSEGLLSTANETLKLTAKGRPLLIVLKNSVLGPER
ncbi:MAG: coproporphyrinogen III oxidase [Rhodobacteraceae bacterium]|nr:coproporphyrinogen III oxidase [Paracoccaceae bacterium]